MGLNILFQLFGNCHDPWKLTWALVANIYFPWSAVPCACCMCLGCPKAFSLPALIARWAIRAQYWKLYFSFHWLAADQTEALHQSTGYTCVWWSGTSWKLAKCFGDQKGFLPHFLVQNVLRIRFVGCLDFIVFIIFGCEQTIRLFTSELSDVSMPWCAVDYLIMVLFK